METQEKEQEITVEIGGDDPIEVTVKDDAPKEDQGREPLPEELVKELEADELGDYSEKVKTRLKQMKKVWHDERRAKESADRERSEAVSLAQRLVEENKKLRVKTNYSETALVASFKESAARQLKDAQNAYKEAFESGDSERVLEAQQELNSAQYRSAQADRYKNTPLQEEKEGVNPQQQQTQQPAVQRDSKAVAWQERNTWFGQNRLMTALALGMHEEMVEKHGYAYATTDEYYSRIDKTMREKFPEEYADTQTGGGKPSRSAYKPATVVAPASRSTAPRKVVLSESQVRLAKKLGVTNEEYAREYVKQQENQNGR